MEDNIITDTNHTLANALMGMAEINRLTDSFKAVQKQFGPVTKDTDPECNLMTAIADIAARIIDHSIPDTFKENHPEACQQTISRINRTLDNVRDMDKTLHTQTSNNPITCIRGNLT